MSRFRLGIQVFLQDMKESIPLAWQFVIVLLAFALFLVFYSGVHF